MAAQLPSGDAPLVVIAQDTGFDACANRRGTQPHTQLVLCGQRQRRPTGDATVPSRER